MISALDLLGCVVLVARLLLLLPRAEHFANHFYDLVRCSFESLVFFYFAQVSSSLMFSIISERMDALQIEKGLNKKKFHYIFHRHFLHGNLTRRNDDRRTMLELNQCSDGSWEYIKYKLCHFYEFSCLFFHFPSPALAANVNDEIMLRKTFEIDGVQYKNEWRMLQERSVHTVTVTFEVVYFPISNSLPSELHEKKRRNQ